MPVQGDFKVEGGVLVSRLGAIEKRAKFAAWTPLYTSAGSASSAPMGWGPCLTEGEVLLPNVFLAEAPAESQVTNRFEAEDFGEGYTLIRLLPAQKHSLCVWFREPRRGQAFFGRLGQNGTAKVMGSLENCELRADYSVYRLDEGMAGMMRVDAGKEDPMLTITASFAGTEVTMGKWTLARKADGWYCGKDKVSK
jgi:hypothetical protein